MKGAVTEVVSPAQIPQMCPELMSDGARMQLAYAWHPEPDGSPEIVYIAKRKPRQPFIRLRCQLPPGTMEIESVAQQVPLLGWYEREIQDLYGITFRNHPEPYPLVLHEGMNSSLPPMDPRYPTGQLLGYTAADWQLPTVEGTDIQVLPFGPIRGDVLETAQIVFYYMGEAILHCHPRLFFKHRGMEKRFEGQTPELAVLLAERVSGVDSVAHSLAFCQAVEAASGCAVPRRAQYLRTILAELERLYNHLYYLGHLCHTTTLKVGEAQGKLLAEQSKQINGMLTGSRFLRGLLTPGGLRRDLNLDILPGKLHALAPQIYQYMDALESTNSHLDRLILTGHLPEKVAFDQGATGPVKRASGIAHDLRSEHPYAAYEHFQMRVPVQSEGDAHARVRIRMQEIRDSLKILLDALSRIPPGPVRAPVNPPLRSEGLGWTEGPRGSIYYCVHFDGAGRFARVKIKSASFSNWRVFPFTVHDTNLMDYAINEASFGLTMAGCDR